MRRAAAVLCLGLMGCAQVIGAEEATVRPGGGEGGGGGSGAGSGAGATTGTGAGAPGLTAYGQLLRSHGAAVYYPFDEPTFSGEVPNALGDGTPAASLGTSASVLDEPIIGEGALVLEINNAEAIASGAIFDDDTFTVELWLRPGTNEQAHSFLLIGDGGVHNLLHRDASGLISVLRKVGTPASQVTGTIPVPEGEAHHVALTSTGNDMQLYVDGQPDVMLPMAFDWQSPPNPALYLGGDDGITPLNGFKGSIDEVAYYPMALSAELIADHYEAGLQARFVD